MSEKFHTAIMRAALVISGICGGIKFAEREIADLIEYTKTVIEELMHKNQASSGFGPNEWARVQTQRLNFLTAINDVEIRSRLTLEQNEQLDHAIKALPSYLPGGLVIDPRLKPINWKERIQQDIPLFDAKTLERIARESKSLTLEIPFLVDPKAKDTTEK